MQEKAKNKRVTARKRAVRKKPDASVSEHRAAPAIVEDQEAQESRETMTETAKSMAKKPTVLGPSFEEIQLRAYFISERRREIGTDGDEYHDWITAEQELRS